MHGVSKDHCIIIHAFSVPATKAIFRRFRQLRLNTDVFDTFVTTDTIEKALAVKAVLPSAIVSLHENRGRDIFPFIETLRSISNLPYASCLKLHSKETKYRSDGAALREKILNELLPSQKTVLRVLDLFEKDPRLGSAAPANLMLKFNRKNMHFDLPHTSALASRMGIETEEFAASLKKSPGFVAGSMLWLRPAALQSLLTLKSQDFPDEIGLSDGTMAHAVERMLLPAIRKENFSFVSLPPHKVRTARPLEYIFAIFMEAVAAILCNTGKRSRRCLQADARSTSCCQTMRKTYIAYGASSSACETTPLSPTGRACTCSHTSSSSNYFALIDAAGLNEIVIVKTRNDHGLDPPFNFCLAAM